MWEPIPSDLEISRDEVHVWRVRLDSPAVVVERLRGTLALDEQARAARFRFERRPAPFHRRSRDAPRTPGSLSGGGAGSAGIPLRSLREAGAGGGDRPPVQPGALARAGARRGRAQSGGRGRHRAGPADREFRADHRAVLLAPSSAPRSGRCPRTRSSRRSSAAGRARSLI